MTTGVEELGPESRLARLRNALADADLPVSLVAWMKEAEEQVAVLRGRLGEEPPKPRPFGYERQEPISDENPNALIYDDGRDTTLVLTCGCTERTVWAAVPRPPRIGDYYACEQHSRRLGYDQEHGEAIYDRDQRVMRVVRDDPDWISLRVPEQGVFGVERPVEGRALYYEEVAHPAGDGDTVTFKVPESLPAMRLAVVLVKLD